MEELVRDAVPPRLLNYFLAQDLERGERRGRPPATAVPGIARNGSARRVEGRAEAAGVN
jgi:hypothetical protein